MGIFSATAFMRFGRDIFGDTGARSATRTLSLAILQAQRAAIRTGDPHGLVARGTIGNVTSWTIVQRSPDGSETIVDGPNVVSDDVSLSMSARESWFDFEGNGQAQLTANLVGPNRSFELVVEPMTRLIRSSETTP